MRTRSRTALASIVRLDFRATVSIGLLAVASFLPAFASEELEELKLTLPAPTLKGTPEELPSGPTIEPLRQTPRPPHLIAKGVQNVAFNKPVTSSVKPFTGELQQVTDGKKEAFDYDAVEMKKGPQWIQVDLGQRYSIQAVVMWHDHRYIQAMHDVIVLISDDPEFKQDARIIFNNDVDNSSGLGVGTDKEYFETHEGKIVDAKGLVGRHVRAYTKGGSLSAMNNWQEIEVYALPVTVLGAAETALPPTVAAATSVLAVEPTEATPGAVAISTESNSNGAGAKPVAIQTASSRRPPKPSPSPAQEVSEPATATPSPKNSEPAQPGSGMAGLNWPTAFLASLVLITILGLIYALRRGAPAAPLAKAK